jgi:hypothetical protein
MGCGMACSDFRKLGWVFVLNLLVCANYFSASGCFYKSGGDNAERFMWGTRGGE